MRSSSYLHRLLPLWLSLFLSTSTTQPIEARDGDWVVLHTNGYSAYDCLDSSRVSDFMTSYPAYWGGVNVYDLPEAALPSRPMSFHIDPLGAHPDGWDYKFYTRSDCTFDDESCALKPNAKGCLTPPVGVWISKVAVKAPRQTITSTTVVTAPPAKRTPGPEPGVLTATPTDGAKAPAVTEVVTSTVAG